MLEGLLGMLAFLGTLLGLVSGIVVLAAAVLAHRASRARRVGAVLLAWVGIYAAALLAVSAASQPRYIQPGAERCFDEMCYSVQGFSIVPSLGAAPNLQPARGNYYLVTVQLRSAARGKAQRPSEPDLFLLDSSGQRYIQALNAGSDSGLPIGQPVSARQLWDQPIQAGESVRRRVAFDLPAGSPTPGLVISEGIGPLSAVIIGDENSFFHAKTIFLLAP